LAVNDKLFDDDGRTDLVGSNLLRVANDRGSGGEKPEAAIPRLPARRRGPILKDCRWKSVVLVEYEEVKRRPFALNAILQ
jgi:hypothetical protein